MRIGSICATNILQTFVIFSMFLTDFNRISISRSVAILRAFAGAAPSGDGWDATRARLRLASIGDKTMRWGIINWVSSAPKDRIPAQDGSSKTVPQRVQESYSDEVIFRIVHTDQFILLIDHTQHIGKKITSSLTGILT
jgi:hypothetical protein